MSKTPSIFSTIRTEGAILPQDLLNRIVSGDSSLDGIKATDYHLSPSERLNEAATRAYSRLSGLWASFSQSMAALPEAASGTTETRERWLLPLFQELGYGRLQVQKSVEIEGKSYPVSHQAAEPVAIHLVSAKWDLDKRNPMAKSQTRLSPHSLVQEFLNRSPNHLWGFVSNGYKLRVLRENISLTRAAYVEFDLQSMMDGESYSDFFLLWLLCHQSRVEVKTDESGRPLPAQTCWLERWYHESISSGVRALDELRDSVQAAIEALGAGFLIHPANSRLKEQLHSGQLSVQSYYAQVLRLVYRLLLIFVAEDRDLLIPPEVSAETRELYLKYYSTLRIRDLAQKHRGSRHCDLWRQLSLLFEGLHSGNPSLGLPALGSYLFTRDATPNLSPCEISNSHLLSAFRHLCYTHKNNVFQLINYRNLGPEELGSVYESLLELNPQIDHNAGTFELKVVSGSERKSTGSYYTPSSLVNSLLDSALEPVIRNALSEKNLSPAAGDPAALQRSAEEALLSLKICDPSCGSGHFLIAAAHRLAKQLAAIRAGEEEPAPSVIQNALRDVIGRCIYGVDINPMAVELCKISLWMEALEPGKPFTFLDHHIRCGNSLLGTNTQLIQEGIPDSAYTAVTGDDRTTANALRKQNREERDLGVMDIFTTDSSIWQNQGVASRLAALDTMQDSNLQELAQKEETYAEIQSSDAYLHQKLVHDAWCAAFVIPKIPRESPSLHLTHSVLENLKESPDKINPALKKQIQNLAETYQFFHWQLAFPEVFSDHQATSPPRHLANSPSDHLATSPLGFDCVLGNPPWEHNELKEKEWFASKDPEIAAASGAKRKRLIANLEQSNPNLYKEYLKVLRYYQTTSVFYNKDSGIYPLCGRGRINTYQIFAELNRKLISSRGRSGFIIPSGIATDDSTKFFFQDIVETASLVSLYDFENRAKLFPAVDSRMKFSLLTLRAPLFDETEAIPADFIFFAHSVADLKDENRRFQLSASDIALINPNTHTCPVFRSQADAELTKHIYRRVPILINENDSEHGNPWDISFKQGLFNMTSDSHLFKTREQLENLDFELQGNRFVSENQIYLPLYEAKMIHHFNHRFGDYADLPAGSVSTQLPEIPLSRLQSADYEPLPRYWIAETEVEQANPENKKHFLGFRDITNTTNERTIISAYFPFSGVSNKLPLLQNKLPISLNICLHMCLNSFACDFVGRFKIGGTSLNFFIAKQLAVLPPAVFSSSPHLEKYIVSRVLELTYTSHSLKDFARDLAYDGPPFIWDEQRRFQIRCELDALFFHLYLGSLSQWQGSSAASDHLASSPSGHLAKLPSRNLAKLPSGHLAHFPSPRHAVEYIMESFPIVKRKDEKEHGEYRSKRRILEIYDAMTPLFESEAPQAFYSSPLDPPPGPPCNADGSFIPVQDWDEQNWPKHIHPKK